MRQSRGIVHDVTRLAEIFDVARAVQAQDAPANSLLYTSRQTRSLFGHDLISVRRLRKELVLQERVTFFIARIVCHPYRHCPTTPWSNDDSPTAQPLYKFSSLTCCAVFCPGAVSVGKSLSRSYIFSS